MTVYMKHTILGACGSTAKALAYQLLKDHHNEVRLVSQCEFWIPGTETFFSDLASCEEIEKCINGSDFVYLCAESLYLSKIIQELWLRIIRYSLNACRKISAKLIYIDNSDIYGRNTAHLTEQTQYRTCTRIGKVLMEASLLLQKEMLLNNKSCLIARSSEIYGPFTNGNNFLNSNVICRLLKGENAMWFIDAEVSHSFTHSADMAKGVILLSATESCYDQLWHLPTSPPLSGETFIHMTSNILNIYPGYTVTSRGMMWLSGIFNKSHATHIDFIDKFETGVSFYSGKFNTFFNYTPVTYYIGIQETIEYLIQSGYPSTAVFSSQKEFC